MDLNSGRTVLDLGVQPVGCGRLGESVTTGGTAGDRSRARQYRGGEAKYQEYRQRSQSNPGYSSGNHLGRIVGTDWVKWTVNSKSDLIHG